MGCFLPWLWRGRPLCGKIRGRWALLVKLEMLNAVHGGQEKRSISLHQIVSHFGPSPSEEAWHCSILTCQVVIHDSCSSLRNDEGFLLRVPVPTQRSSRSRRKKDKPAGCPGANLGTRMGQVKIALKHVVHFHHCGFIIFFLLVSLAVPLGAFFDNCLNFGNRRGSSLGRGKAIKVLPGGTLKKREAWPRDVWAWFRGNRAVEKGQAISILMWTALWQCFALSRRQKIKSMFLLASRCCVLCSSFFCQPAQKKAWWDISFPPATLAPPVHQANPLRHVDLNRSGKVSTANRIVL